VADRSRTALWLPSQRIRELRDADDEQPGLRLAGRVDPADRGLVVVEARRSVTLPFVGWLGVAQVQVAAVARARAPVAP
jgi:hypothetical protein